MDQSKFKNKYFCVVQIFHNKVKRLVHTRIKAKSFEIFQVVVAKLIFPNL